jgi:hypothetical protein
MVEQLTFQIIFQFLQTVGILVGVYYYISTLRNAQKAQNLQIETRQAQLFMQIFSETYDEQAAKSRLSLARVEIADYDDWYQRYYLDLDGAAKFNTMAIYLEGIGVLVKRKLIDPSLVDDLISTSVLSFWDGAKGFVYEHRRRTNDHDYCEWVEYLAEEIRALRARRDQERIELKT